MIKRLRFQLSFVHNNAQIREKNRNRGRIARCTSILSKKREVRYLTWRSICGSKFQESCAYETVAETYHQCRHPENLWIRRTENVDGWLIACLGTSWSTHWMDRVENDSNPAKSTVHVVGWASQGWCLLRLGCSGLYSSDWSCPSYRVPQTRGQGLYTAPDSGPGVSIRVEDVSSKQIREE